LVLSDLIISSEAKIKAEDLMIDSGLETQGSGNLKAVEGKGIIIKKDVKMSFRETGDTLLFLGLGQIEGTYDIVLTDLVVGVDAENYNKTNLSGLRTTLVAGRRLSNWELLAAKARLSDHIHFNLTCRDTTSGWPLYASERKLVLVGLAHSNSEGAGPPPTDTL
jgi:hypothetical protein